MKKAFKILTTVLAVAMGCSVFASCSEIGGTEEKANNALLFDFNDDDNIPRLYYLNFARITLNTYAAYVSDGTGSYLF